MKQMIKKSCGEEATFIQMLEEKVDHYIGVHDKCEDQDYCKKAVFIKDMSAKEAFVVNSFKY
jgi:hypothetical protein